VSNRFRDRPWIPSRDVLDWQVRPPDLVLMGDMQGIAVQLHVQEGQVTPGAADGVELTGRQARSVGAEGPGHCAPHPFGVHRAGRAEGQGPKGKAHPLARVVEADKLEAGASEVACNAGGVRLSRQDAEGSVSRLLLAGEDAHGDAGFLLHRPEEVAAVPRLADGGRGHHEGLPARPSLQEDAEAPQGGHGDLDTFG